MKSICAIIVCLMLLLAESSSMAVDSSLNSQQRPMVGFARFDGTLKLSYNLPTELSVLAGDVPLTICFDTNPLFANKSSVGKYALFPIVDSCVCENSEDSVMWLSPFGEMFVMSRYSTDGKLRYRTPDQKITCETLNDKSVKVYDDTAGLVYVYRFGRLVSVVRNNEEIVRVHIHAGSRLADRIQYFDRTLLLVWNKDVLESIEAGRARLSFEYDFVGEYAAGSSTALGLSRYLKKVSLSTPGLSTEEPQVEVARNLKIDPDAASVEQQFFGKQFSFVPEKKAFVSDLKTGRLLSDPWSTYNYSYSQKEGSLWRYLKDGSKEGVVQNIETSSFLRHFTNGDVWESTHIGQNGHAFGLARLVQFKTGLDQEKAGMTVKKYFDVNGRLQRVQGEALTTINKSDQAKSRVLDKTAWWTQIK